MEVRIEQNLQSRVAELVCKYANRDVPILFVSDPDTHQAAGETLLAALPHAEHYLLPSHPGANIAEVNAIKEAALGCACILAVGSGTINDLCKYASAQLGIPYVVFATAASMNGYASANASITVNGIKSTLPAQTPAAIFVDLDVIAASPLAMSRAGLGDSLCRPTAQTDWLLSYYLMGTEYDPTPFEWLAPYEVELFAQSERLNDRDHGYLRLLMETLIASGKGMTHCSGSYPASQGEHLIAHTMEMLNSTLPYHLHGEEIGVTTLTMALLQEERIKERPTIKAHNPGIEEFTTAFGQDRAEALHRQFQIKAISNEQAESINDMLSDNWVDIRWHLESIMLPYDMLKSTLQKAGAYTSHTELGWSDAAYANAIKHAHLVRDRFTFLDIKTMSSQASHAVAKLKQVSRKIM